MGIFWKLLIIACVLVPMIYALHYFGILVTRAGANWLRAEVSLPTRWEGKFAGATGFQKRNFVVFGGRSTLAVEAEIISGTLGFEVKAPDGSSLSPASGAFGRDAQVLFDVKQYKRCTVALSMTQFNGCFRVALQ